MFLSYSLRLPASRLYASCRSLSCRLVEAIDLYIDRWFQLFIFIFIFILILILICICIFLCICNWRTTLQVLPCVPESARFFLDSLYSTFPAPWNPSPVIDHFHSLGFFFSDLVRDRVPGHYLSTDRHSYPFTHHGQPMLRSRLCHRPEWQWQPPHLDLLRLQHDVLPSHVPMQAVSLPSLHTLLQEKRKQLL